jgi:hypothetical protein
VRLPLIIATAVLLVVGALAGAVALGSAADAEPPPIEPITVQAPAAPPAPLPAPVEPAPRDDDGYVAPPPPVDDDGPEDDGPDDGPDDVDDGPDDDD